MKTYSLENNKLKEIETPDPIVTEWTLEELEAQREALLNSLHARIYLEQLAAIDAKIAKAKELGVKKSEVAKE